MKAVTVKNNVTISLPEAAFQPTAVSFWVGAVFGIVCFAALVGQN